MEIRREVIKAVRDELVIEGNVISLQKKLIVEDSYINESLILIRDAGRHTCTTGAVNIDKTNKIGWKVIEIPSNVTNNSGITCQDCDSRKIKSVVVHANGSTLFYCSRHR